MIPSSLRTTKSKGNITLLLSESGLDEEKQAEIRDWGGHFELRTSGKSRFAWECSLSPMYLLFIYY